VDRSPGEAVNRLINGLLKSVHRALDHGDHDLALSILCLLEGHLGTYPEAVRRRIGVSVTVDMFA
jgi:hypothetical protein